MFFLIHCCTDTTAYSLLEGQKAQERLDIQNDFNRPLLTEAFEKIPHVSGAKVLDFGCGTSSAYPDIRALIGPKGQYVGIDRSAEQIAFNKARFHDAEYIIGDAETASVKEALSSADIIYIRFVVMHQKNPACFLEKIYRAAKPGAFIVIQEPESDDRRKGFVESRYPFATELCDFKERIGQAMGLDYNFAKHIESVLEPLKPKQLLHSKAYIELPMPQAKDFLTKTFDEIHTKNPAVLSTELLARYKEIVSRLPEGKDDKKMISGYLI